MGFVERALNKISNTVLPNNEDMSDLALIEKAIVRWKNSPERILQIKGQLYYQNEHDILKRKRTMIGENGELEEVENLPNNRIIDNQYAKMVNQKTNYLLGKPFTIAGDNDSYVDLLNQVFNKRFMRTLKNAGKASYNHGISWLYPYYNESGEFSFRLFPGYEILPFWADSEHTKLQCAVRLYLVTKYENNEPKDVEKVEVFDYDGIHCYTLEGGSLKPDPDVEEPDCSYVMAGGNPLNWERIPLIPLKANEEEIPLLKRVKSLQDGINVMLSDFENNMQEDARNTILVLKNYDGTNLGEFRRNLATYGAVKVRNDDSSKGGVETLEVTVDADNYKQIAEIFKKALIENAMGYDAKDDRLSGNPNQMNIQSMYSDIDLDANEMETEYQSSFEEMLWFVNAHLANTGKGSFETETVDIVFNRDVLINETEIIDNCAKSTGIISEETIIAKHPWVNDPAAELDKIEEQKEKAMEQFGGDYDPFGEKPEDEGNDEA